MDIIAAGTYFIFFSFLLFLLRTRLISKRDSLLKEENGLEALLHDYCDVRIYKNGASYLNTAWRTARVSIYCDFIVASGRKKVLLYGKRIEKAYLKKGFLSSKYVVIDIGEGEIFNKVLVFTFFPERTLKSIEDLMTRCEEKK